MSKPQSISESMAQSQVEEDALYATWALGDYDSEDCPKCGRHRLCKCPNGKRRCEKCNWCPEDGDYAPVTF